MKLFPQIWTMSLFDNEKVRNILIYLYVSFIVTMYTPPFETCKLYFIVRMDRCIFDA